MRGIAVVGLTGLALLMMAGSARAGDCGWLSAGAAYGSPNRLGVFVEGGCEFEGKSPFALLAGGQVALGGGELTLGTGWRAGEGSLNLKAVLAHSWTAAEDSGEGSALVGGRLEYSVLGMLSVNGGVLVPVAGASGKGARFTWGIGVGIPLWLLGWKPIGPIEF